MRLFAAIAMAHGPGNQALLGPFHKTFYDDDEHVGMSFYDLCSLDIPVTSANIAPLRYQNSFPQLSACPQLTTEKDTGELII